MAPALDPMVGRYVRLAIDGVPHRVYFEEAGPETGIPLVCLHTAGADNRQFRHLLADPEITRRFRVLAFDMPWHGKSSPPQGFEREEYRLTRDFYTGFVVAFADALSLQRPVVMGCSIGGRVVLNLAATHADRFRALVGLQASAHVAPYYDTDWLHHADVHGGEVCAGIVSGLVGPDAPAVHRWETLWHYMQGGPGVFKGDLHFYKVDGDLRQRIATIDARRCPLFLLTGEYDYSCSPAETEEVAALVPGARCTIMPGLGHFPMSEDPERFLEHLRPVLSEIEELA
ncbi:alpha/beta fold hydrolase [Reyranella sp.]|uniref:alpha/beta fold hydrolase n=1 Tax=Reyranella sp. TaxID=1929291 RepID=UPI0027189872|nr:alpha/beta hydrolase [Reyranella sp.]MDO8975445.1 alpha/beta hydrolase [Reyranella sp.]